MIERGMTERGFLLSGKHVYRWTRLKLSDFFPLPLPSVKFLTQTGDKSVEEEKKIKIVEIESKIK